MRGAVAIRVQGRHAHARRQGRLALVPVPELLRTLLTTPGPSGYENDAAEVWRAAAREFAEVSDDALGSSVARVPGTGEGPSLALVGHIDEIGLTVTYVDDKGFLFFRGLGGWLPETLLAQRVEILGRSGPVPGVISKKRSPFKKDKDEKVELADLHIDVGVKDKDEALGIVRIGDAAVLVAEPLELPNGRLVSRSLDNRLGCYVALEAARRVAEAGGVPGDLIAVAAVGEEVGDFAGARTTAYAVRPDVAIAIDVTSARDIPDADLKNQGEVKIGDGAAIARGAPLSAQVFELLWETAEQEGIPCAIDVVTGSTHTDADAYHLSRVGIPTGLISIPTRYIHTPTEMVALDDVEACVRLAAAVAQRLSATFGA